MGGDLESADTTHKVFLQRFRKQKLLHLLTIGNVFANDSLCN